MDWLSIYASDEGRNHAAADRRWYSSSRATKPHCRANRFRQRPELVWKLDVCTASDLACASEPVDGSGDVRSFCSMSTVEGKEREEECDEMIEIPTSPN